MTNTTNLANQLAYACQVDPAAAGPALRYAFRLAILNSTPHEIKLLASQLPQNPPEGADPPGWAPDAFRLAILNSTPHEIKLLASQLPQNPPEGTASPWWNPAPLAASLRLYADDLNRSPLALGGK